MEGAKPEKDYYSKPDPARLKLIRNVERFHKAKKHSYYYRQPIPKLPEQKKGKKTILHLVLIQKIS